jgi:hypothetical protein
MRFRVAHLLALMTCLAVLLTAAVIMTRNTQLAALTLLSYAFVMWLIYDMRER